MFARFLHSSKIDNYNHENYRSKHYQETKSGVRVCHILRLTLLYAKEDMDNIIQIGRYVLRGNCKVFVMFGTESQPLDEPIYRKGHRRIGQQTWPVVQADCGQFRRTSSNRSYRKEQTECQESQCEVAAGYRQGSRS